MTQTITAPTYAEYEQLLAEAQASVRADGGFVDPVKMHAYCDIGRGKDWQVSIIGHSNNPTLTEMHMLLLADQRRLTPPLPEWLAAKRAVQRAERAAEEDLYRQWMQARTQAWEQLKAALPVPVVLAYNYSGGNHYATWTQGADHIIVTKDVTAGRWQRSEGEAFCTTDSNAHQQDFVWWKDETDAARLPTCKNCLKRAAKLSGQDVTVLLNSSRRSVLPF